MKEIGAVQTPSGDGSRRPPVGAKGRLLYIDNIRTYLTILVVLHHLMVIYAGSGGWIWRERREDVITNALGSWFCAVNQAYFMGLFLFISAYFVPGAYDRKGPGKFILDRLVRLGIPLAVYSWVLRPLLIYAGVGGGLPFWRWYSSAYFRDYGLIGGGPLWFIEALLAFSLLYVIARLVTRRPPAPPVREYPFPRNSAIALFALLLAAASFLVRLASPVNEMFEPLNLQFANFSQYVALFVAGLIAYRRKWLDSLPDKVGKLWLGVAALLALLFVPLGLMTLEMGDDPFLGGWHWQAFAYALWDALLCVSSCIGVVYVFRGYLNAQGGLARELSQSAYTAYLIHEPVITFAALFAAGVMLHPLLKFAISAIVLVPLCFALSGLIRRIPCFDCVL